MAYAKTGKTAEMTTEICDAVQICEFSSTDWGVGDGSVCWTLDPGIVVYATHHRQDAATVAASRMLPISSLSITTSISVTVSFLQLKSAPARMLIKSWTRLDLPLDSS